MEEKEYGECPKCKSTNSVLEDSEFHSGSYYDDLKCEDCGCEWKERFQYNSYVIK